MKTITIRLSENEAKALDRLASVSGLSKNKQIVHLIASAYGELDKGAVIIKGDILSVTQGLEWAKLVNDDLADKEISKKEIEEAIRIVQYVLDNECGSAQDDEISNIKDLRKNLLRKYRT